MAPRPSRTRRQEPMIPFWIKSALYSAEGTLLANVNVTTPQDGAGYLDRSPDGTSLIFATEVKQPTVSRYLTLGLSSLPALPRPSFFWCAAFFCALPVRFFLRLPSVGSGQQAGH